MNLFLLITLFLSFLAACVLEASHDEATGVLQFVIDTFTAVFQR